MVVFQGALRLNGAADYASIAALLITILEKAPAILIIDLCRLDYLKSSGVNMLSKLVIRLRHQSATQLVFHGSEESFWQKKTLRNLQRLMPGLRLEMV